MPFRTRGVCVCFGTIPSGALVARRAMIVKPQPLMEALAVLNALEQRIIEDLTPYVNSIASTFINDANRGHASDIRQTALLAACEALEAYQPHKGPIREFVALCVRNKLGRLAEYTKRREVVRTVSSDSVILQNQQNRERPPRVYWAIKNLQEPYFSLAEAAYIHKLTHRELRERFRLSKRQLLARLATVRSKIQLALDDGV